MAATATLAVSLKARTRAFNNKMKRSQKTVRSFGASVRRLAGGLAKLGTLGATVAAGGLALLVKRSFSNIDALTKFASKLGIVVDELRGLERAAELSGIKVETFRKALTLMTRNAAEASTGVGEALVAFRLLRIDVTKLGAMNADKIFLRIGKAFKEVKLSRTEQVGVIGDIFGGRGSDVIRIFDLGVDRLEKMIKRSKELFGSLSKIDASKIEAANDAFADMLRSVTGLSDAIAIHIAIPLGAVFDTLTDKIVGARQAIVGEFGAMTEGIFRFTVGINDALIKVGEFALATKKGFAALGHTFFGPGSPFPTKTGSVSREEDELFRMAMALDDMKRNRLTVEGLRESFRKIQERANENLNNLLRGSGDGSGGLAVAGAGLVRSRATFGAGARPIGGLVSTSNTVEGKQLTVMKGMAIDIGIIKTVIGPLVIQ